MGSHNKSCLTPFLILNYKDRRTQAFIGGEFVREFHAFERQVWRRIEMLKSAASLADLRALPTDRLESLKGDRQGQFSIRINDQWRICFEWSDQKAGASNVKIVDYH